MGIIRMTEKCNEKWVKNANCERPYSYFLTFYKEYIIIYLYQLTFYYIWADFISYCLMKIRTIT